MLFYANELLLLLGGLSSTIVLMVAIVLAFAVTACPHARLPSKTLLLLGASIPLGMAVFSSIRGWWSITEICYYLQQQNAISEVQLQLLLDESKRDNAWLIFFGAVYSNVLWTLISWRTRRKTHQTSSIHQATRV